MIDVASGLLYPALRKAGITLGPGRTPSDAQFQDALEELNRLAASLSLDRLFIYALDIVNLQPISSDDESYTIGIDPTGAQTADFAQAAPLMITAANLIGAGGGRTALSVATPQEWASSDHPGGGSMMYYDRAAPIATIWLDGVTADTQSLELWTWHQIPAFNSISNAVTLPPGYEDAITLNLAVRLGPHFQRPIDPALRADARESLMRVLSLNAPQPIASTGGMGCGCNYNVYTDSC